MPQTLRHRAEDVREGIASRPFLTKSGPISISMSIGAVTIEELVSINSD